MTDVKASVKKEQLRVVVPKRSFRKTSSKKLKWEFDVILNVLFPFLSSKDQQSFSLVNHTMKEWMEEACRVHLKRNHITDTELKRFFSFAKKENKSFLTQKLMFDRYKDLRVNGKKRRNVKSFNKASMTVLIFYLYLNNKRALHHLMHLCKDFDPSVAKIIRRLWLRVQMHNYKYKTGINTEQSRTTEDNDDIMSHTSVKYNKKRNIVSIQNITRRLCRSKRQKTRVNRYTPSLDGKFLDDEEGEEGDIDLENDEGVEERSSDSDDSEGSLREFIVNDDEDEEEESSEENVSGNDERELSDDETDCSSEYSVYSEDE